MFIWVLFMKNYVKLLTEQDVKNFLKQNNLVLYDGLFDKNGNPLKSIEKESDFIFVRCKHINRETNSVKDKIRNMVFNGFPISSLLFETKSVYDFISDTEIIFMENFSLSKINACENEENIYDKQLAESYYNYMANKFGEEYINDYKKYKKHLKDKENEMSL